MQKHDRSDSTLHPDQLTVLANNLETNGRPILAYRVVGQRVEFHLLGGETLQVPLEEKELADMNYEELLALARELKIRGRSAMDTLALQEAIGAARQKEQKRL